MFSVCELIQGRKRNIPPSLTADIQDLGSLPQELFVKRQKSKPVLQPGIPVGLKLGSGPVEARGI